MDPERLQKLQEEVFSNSWIWIGAVVAIFVGGMAIYWIRNWFRDGTGPADSDDQIFLEMQELHRQGQITDEEFRSIKSQYRNPS
ncbi:MAG: hypothetical protein KDA88_21395 [Planctomycetaceae bacterium]|nr:hypothetical protein [Planctomycetaceae bacterium]MCA9029768.1 hypothetical protein [Planctomycetaceae bacterium]MCB9949494.1 hypothetical protein [Planctomycetaceae bacterium]